MITTTLILIIIVASITTTIAIVTNTVMFPFAAALTMRPSGLLKTPGFVLGPFSPCAIASLGVA